MILLLSYCVIILCTLLLFQDGNLLSAIFEKIVIAMVLYFILSIVNSMAQRYHKRLCKARHAVGDSVYVKKDIKKT